VVRPGLCMRLEGWNDAEPDHWTERGRAASVSNSDTTGRPRRSVLAFAVKSHVRRTFVALVVIAVA